MFTKLITINHHHIHHHSSPWTTSRITMLSGRSHSPSSRRVAGEGSWSQLYPRCLGPFWVLHVEFDGVDFTPDENKNSNNLTMIILIVMILITIIMIIMISSININQYYYWMVFTITLVRSILNHPINCVSYQYGPDKMFGAMGYRLETY